MIIIRILKEIYRINLWKTIIFNVSNFPFMTATRLPIVFYGKCQTISGGGDIMLNVKPRYGILKIGDNNSWTYGIKRKPTEVTYICINGTLKINGDNISILNGCKVYIKKKACLSLSKDIIISSRTKIHCANYIEIGSHVWVSWENQIFDTNMHYIDENGIVRNNKGTVKIDDNCWIGNRCTLQKGTNLPKYTIVAQSSIVNKDFTDSPSGTIAGMPAKLIKEGTRKIFDSQLENKLDNWFWDHPAEKCVAISEL